MSARKEKSSADKAALDASLPGAAAHVISRLLFRWLLLPLAIVVPVGGIAGIAWRFVHLRLRADDAADTQAAVAKLTDEAEGRVDEALRSETEADPRANDAARARRRGGPTKEQLEAIAGALTALEHLPTQEELLRLADEARRQGRWEDAATRYGRIASAFEKSDPRTAATARHAQAELLLDKLGDVHGAKRSYRQYVRAAWEVSPELGSQAEKNFELAQLRSHP